MYSEAFYKLSEVAAMVHGAPLNQHQGCVEVQVDSRWWFALNPHGEASDCSKCREVPPYHAYVELNGFTAASLNPFDGVFLAGGPANEDALIAALDERMRSDGEGT